MHILLVKARRHARRDVCVSVRVTILVCVYMNGVFEYMNDVCNYTNMCAYDGSDQYMCVSKLTGCVCMSPGW